MENMESKLLHMKATLYAMLAFLLCVILLIGFVKTDSDTGCATKTEEPFCGTESVHSASPPFQNGKELFLVNCASCHNKNMKDHLTGPALHGVSERWSAYPRKDLYEWIRRSQTMIKKGHPRAMELWRDWKPVIMNDFARLTDADIEAILFYIETQSASVYSKAEVKK